jgi:beta-N-acetylhexosaminidase
MSNIGQMVFTGISGTSLTDDEAKFIEEENIGGVVLFKNNYETPGQLAELVNSIQALRKEYPLYIAVDHEGGRVMRFRTSFTQFPPMLDLAKTESPKNCFQVATIMADELSACGINLNLSPVCDILTNQSNKVIGDRAFGKEPESVSKFISSMIRGFQTNKVMACAKHFPGHGSTTKDSHFDLPIVKKELSELQSDEFVPFVKAIKSRVEFVMMAHLIVEGIDPDLPCTLSPKAYEILRNDLKFNKLIISDDMQMKAIADNFGTGEAAVMAIKAGADIIEYKDMDQARIALDALKQAAKTKELKNDIIKDRTDRINESKKENLKDYTPIYIPEIAKKINTKQSQAFLNDITEKIDQLSK